MKKKGPTSKNFWHSLINFKSNYLSKKLLKWDNKNVRILTLCWIFFFLKKRKTPEGIIILHLCTKNLHDKIYSSWNIECDERAGTRYGSWDTEWETEFFVILGNFLSFDPPHNPKNQNFEKIKKASGDVTILHMSVKNHNHMMFTSWDMETDRQLFVILDQFLPFYPTIDSEN